jgi:quercetin dioxygenase-like cupin family protein
MKNELIENAYPCHVPDRLLDGQLLLFNFPEIIKKIKNEDAWKRGDRNAITLLKSASMRIVIVALHEMAEISFHQSGNTISVQLLEGYLNFQTANQSVLLKKGSLLTLHEAMKHTLIAMDESVILLTIAICPAS